MGLHADITQAIQDAFNSSLADAVRAVDIVYSSTVYDPVNGIVTPTDTIVNTRGVVEPVSNEMIDGEIVQLEDVSFIILQDELSVVPKIGDTILVNGVSYSVNIVLIDPAGVAWNMVGRAV